MTKNYEKIGQTEITANNLPASTQSISVFEDPKHLFEMKSSKSVKGFFEIYISVGLLSRPPLDWSATIMNEVKGDIKVSDTYIRFNTLDTFKVNSDDKYNYELAYNMLVDAIGNFNYMLQRQGSNFGHGREYRIPLYEDVKTQIEWELREIE